MMPTGDTLMRLPALTALGLAASLFAPLAQAQDGGLLRCRALVDAGARLACYDALPIGATAAGGARAPSPAGAAPTAAPATPQGAFGLPQTAQPGGELKFIDSQINGRFEGWNPEQLIELANGQVWRVVDGSRAYFQSDTPKVRIERGVLGSFYMVITGTNQAPRVRRVK